MSDVKRLLEEATPLPWYQTGDSVDADERLILYAVNRLPDYEAVARALSRLIDCYMGGDLDSDEWEDAWTEAALSLEVLKHKTAVPA